MRNLMAKIISICVMNIFKCYIFNFVFNYYEILGLGQFSLLYSVLLQFSDCNWTNFDNTRKGKNM